jgi:hypothetical protein
MVVGRRIRHTSANKSAILLNIIPGFGTRFRKSGGSGLTTSPLSILPVTGSGADDFRYRSARIDDPKKLGSFSGMASFTEEPRHSLAVGSALAEPGNFLRLSVRS